jgi:hypothetical protein
MVARQVDACPGDCVIAVLHIAVCRKPLEGTVIENVQRYGVGGLNIDGCRMATNTIDSEAMKRCNTPGSWRMLKGGGLQGTNTFSRSSPTGALDTTKGRWPANLVIDAEAAQQLNKQSGVLRAGWYADQDKGGPFKNSESFGKDYRHPTGRPERSTGDTGGAARFFKRIVT